MTPTTADFWALIHAERARVADMLDRLTPQQWRAGSLCTEWTVEQVTAHLSAAASTGTWVWIRSIVRAGFNADRHNARLLARHLGDTPEETAQRFRNVTMTTVAPTKDYAAVLGEVIVHGQDIAQPLGIDLTPDPAAVHEVATFFAAKDFAVDSHRLVAGLTLEAADSDFTTGHGPLVRGRLLHLTMVMAGRPHYLAELDGDGVAELRRRIETNQARKAR